MLKEIFGRALVRIHSGASKCHSTFQLTSRNVQTIPLTCVILIVKDLEKLWPDAAVWGVCYRVFPVRIWRPNSQGKWLVVQLRCISCLVEGERYFVRARGTAEPRNPSVVIGGIFPPVLQRCSNQYWACITRISIHLSARPGVIESIWPFHVDGSWMVCSILFRSVLVA